MTDRPWTQEEMIDLAATGVGKVCAKLGRRGPTLVSVEETAAMAAVLMLYGLAPILPEPTETQPRKEAL